MAQVVRNRQCCGRGMRPLPQKDFCSLLRISAGVTLIESSGKITLNINHMGQQKDLAQQIATHNCPDRTAGVQLAKVCLHALDRAVAMGQTETLATKVGRQMPLVLMKDFLFKTAGTCSSCRGRGCTACHKMGVA